MPLPGAGILSYMRLGLASPSLAPSRPNLPVLKIESIASNWIQREVNCC
jgi:hypothetical protein